MEIVYSNKSGFTLIELMVSVLILMVGILALLQMVNVSISHGLTNQFRNEASLVADEALLNQQAKGYDQIAIATNSSSISRQLLGSTFKNYSVVTTGTTISNNTKQVDVTVSWVYKKVRYTQQAATLITKVQ